MCVDNLCFVLVFSLFFFSPFSFQQKLCLCLLYPKSLLLRSNLIVGICLFHACYEIYVFFNSSFQTLTQLLNLVFIFVHYQTFVFDFLRWLVFKACKKTKSPINFPFNHGIGHRIMKGFLPIPFSFSQIHLIFD